jgi:sec-independent protein translocase protein TatA
VIGDILQPTHLLFVLVIALLVLGPKRLPEVGRSLGRGLRDFRSALNGDEKDRESFLSQPIDINPAPPVTTTPPVATAPVDHMSAAHTETPAATEVHVATAAPVVTEAPAEHVETATPVETAEHVS